MSTATPTTRTTRRPVRFERDVIRGLCRAKKFLLPKYFYDARGSELFERICEQPEYYPTRTELRIMKSDSREIAAHLGGGQALLELGSGASLKTRLLIEQMENLAAYLPFDISPQALRFATHELQAEFPGLRVIPVCGDFMADLEAPWAQLPAASGLTVYFPGSTIGNLSSDEAVGLMQRLWNPCLRGGFLVGVDLEKDIDILEAAYNDEAGVTAQFNLNILSRINRELDGGFDLRKFEHRAFYNRALHRIEMHLMSLERQCVEVAGVLIPFDAGETICTEYSHKYSLERFALLAEQAGFVLERAWTDPQDWFAVCLLRPNQHLSAPLDISELL